MPPTGLFTFSRARNLASILAAALLSWALAGCGNTPGAVIAPPPPATPTVTLTASPASIMLGAATSLTWSSTNASSCAASGGWSGAEATSGTASETPTAAGTATYTLTCTGAGGSANASAAVTVAAPAAPAVTLTANPTTITQGASTTLTWSSNNATACTASGGWSGTQATSGTAKETPTAAGSASYALTCTGAGGNATASATVTVNAPAPTVTLAVSPASIVAGGSATLTWSSTNATGCTASGAWSGAEAASGTAAAAPAGVGSYTYTLTCSGAGGNGSGAATLTVTAPPAAGYVYALNGSGNISAYSEAAAGGGLTLLSSSPVDTGLASPEAVIVDAQQHLLFAAGGAGSGQPTGEIVAFAMDPATGNLSNPVVTTPPDVPTAMAVGPSGTVLYVVSHNQGAVMAYTVAATGALTPISGSPYAVPGVNCGLFCETPADYAAYSAKAETLYVGSGYGFVATFTVNPGSGALTFVYNEDTPTDDTGVAVNPAGTFVYAPGITNSGGAGALYAFAVTTTAQTPAQAPEPLTALSGSPFAAGNTPVSPLLDATGGFLYVLNRGDNSVWSYTLGADGTPSETATSPVAITNGTSNAREMAMDGAGKNLYVASADFNGNTGGITQFSVDGATGAVAQVGTAPISPGQGASGPLAIAVYTPQS